MAATMASSMSLNPKCSTTLKPLLSKPVITSKFNTISSTTPSKSNNNLTLTATSSTAIASAIFATLGSCDAAFAAQQITDLAEGSDNRGTLLLLVIAPAIGWVLFNILQPALNQINKMRNNKGVIVGLGLGGLMALAGSNNEASAAVSEIGRLAATEAGSDNRGSLLLLVVAPAIGWVMFNNLQPALNQINRMRSD